MILAHFLNAAKRAELVVQDEEGDREVKRRGVPQQAHEWDLWRALHASDLR